MLYEEPKMELIVLEAEDIITLSHDDEADLKIEGSNNPWQN